MKFTDVVKVQNPEICFKNNIHKIKSMADIDDLLKKTPIQENKNIPFEELELECKINDFVYDMQKKWKEFGFFDVGSNRSVVRQFTRLIKENIKITHVEEDEETYSEEEFDDYDPLCDT